MEYYTDEIINCLCKWCNLKKIITRSKSFQHKLMISQTEGSICFDCHTLWNREEFICDECTKIINNNHPFTYEYNTLTTDYDFYGVFSFCRKCLDSRNYKPNIEHIIQHHKNIYINNISDDIKLFKI